MLAVQDCADVATHVIADEGWPMPRTLGDGFTRLAEHGVITRATAQRLVAAVGRRNVVAHTYDTLDATKLHAASTAGLLDLDRFAREVAAWLSSQTTPP